MYTLPRDSNALESTRYFAHSQKPKINMGSQPGDGITKPSSTASLKLDNQEDVKNPKVKATKSIAKPSKPFKSEFKVEDDKLFVSGLVVDPEPPAAARLANPKTKVNPTPPPEPVEEAAIKLALNVEKDEAVRVLRKEKCASLGLASVKQLKSLLQKHAGSFPEGAAWIEQCNEIIKLGNLPRILVGVLGYTGSGKSSLINALVEQETIVPCNAMRASTSVVVEIAYNTSDDPSKAFMAEIQFVTAQQWNNEFDVLAEDIKNRPSTEQLVIGSGTDASLAYAKLSAVYPGVAISRLVEMGPADRNRERDLSDVLGQSYNIEQSEALKFSEDINAYIDSSNKGTDADEFAYWPLIRMVKVYIKSDILKHGLVLVDLPGLGDSNVGRTRVAENYIKELRHMWIVADIVRAIDDRVANELMSQSFKRQLLMDGRYHENFVTFVMTKTDQLNTQEVIQSLRLDKSVLKEESANWNRLNNELEFLKEQLVQKKHEQRQCRRSLKKFADKAQSSSPSSSDSSKKRKLAEAGSEADVPLDSKERGELFKALNAAVAAETDLASQISKVKKSISSLNNKMKSVCVQERNKYTQKHLQQDFKTGQGELKDELEAAGGNIAFPGFQGGSSSSLTTYCVSSKAYQKLRGRFRRDNSIKCFANMNDTNIPKLQAFADQCTLADREYAADTILTEVTLFKVTLRSWAVDRGTNAQLSPEQRDQLKKDIEKHYQVVKKATEKIKKNVMQNIKYTIDTRVQVSLKRAIETGSAKMLELSKGLANGDIHGSTWKAICRRNGDKYQTGKKVVYQWNDDFLGPFIDPLTGPWTNAFQVRIPAQHAGYSRAIIEAMREFQKSIQGSITRICGKYDLTHGIFQQVDSLENQIRTKVKEALSVGQNHAKDAHRTVAETVKSHMLHYYAEAREDRGTGVGNRMKRSLVKFTKAEAKSMFENASKTVVAELDNMRSILQKELSAAASHGQQKFKRDILRIVNLGGVGENSKKSAATAELRRLIMKGLADADEAWEKELTNPAEDLRARNPFANIPQIDQDGQESGDDEFNAEGTDNDSASESESEEEKSEDYDDFDDSDDVDDKDQGE